MHTSKDDYLINTLRFVSRKEASQIYGAVLPEFLTSPEMKESKAYKTYLGYAIGEVPPKVAIKFKKASPSKNESDLVPGDEEPVKKGKRLKTLAKKSASKPATCIVIREPHVETKSKRKEKEKLDVAHGKVIELLSEVAMSEKAQIKEARMKSLRDFHKTHPSGSGTVAEKPPSVENITPTGQVKELVINQGNDEDDSNNKQESSDESSKQGNESKEQELDSKQDEESDDDDQEQEEIDQENESEDDEMKSDEEQGMDDTTDQFDDDADTRLEEPTKTATGIVQGEGSDTEMTEAQQGNENLETTQEQVVEDAYVIISNVPKKTEVLIVSPLDVHVHHEVPRTQAPTLLTIPVSVIPESSPVFINIPQSSHTFTPTPIQTTPTPPPTIETTNPLSNLPSFLSIFRFNDRITTLEKEFADLKKNPLHTQVTSLVDSHLDTRLGETRQEFMNFLSESLTARIKEQVQDQLAQILPKEVSTFAPPVIEKMIKESRDEVTLAKASSQPQSTYELGRKDMDKDEDPSAGSDQGLKKIKLSKDVEPTTGPKKKDSTSGSSKGNKSQLKSSGMSVQSEELVVKVADSDMPQDQEGNMGDNEDEPRK
ncbi:hypothetical protein Tco_1422463 [Tanacetum coccineum]